jgi:hypothetical protein
VFVDDFFNVSDPFFEQTKVSLHLVVGEFGQVALFLELDSSFALVLGFIGHRQNFLLVGLADRKEVADVFKILFGAYVALFEVEDVKFEVNVVAPVRFLDLHPEAKEQLLLPLFFCGIFCFLDDLLHLIDILLLLLIQRIGVMILILNFRSLDR